MTARTEALAKAYDEFTQTTGSKVMTKEQFICYALSALPSSGPAEDLAVPPVSEEATEQEQN